MKLLTIPPRLRIWAAVSLLALPAIALQTYWASAAPWWRIPWVLIAWVVGVVAVFLIPLLWGLVNLRSWAVPASLVFTSAWISASVFWSIRFFDTRMAMFTVGVSALIYLIGSALRSEYARSFLNPEIEWFEGAPTAIPGLECRLIRGDQSEILSVARLDEDGTFLFSKRGKVPAFRRKDRPELQFLFRGHQVRVPAQPIAALKSGRAAGFRFVQERSDRFKNLGDFIEILRGEGHA